MLNRKGMSWPMRSPTVLLESQCHLVYTDYVLGILGLYLYMTAEDMKREREGECYVAKGRRAE